MDLLEATSVAKKLLIKTAQHWLFYNSPNGFTKSFTSLSIEIKAIFSPNEIFNGVLLFVKNSSELESHLSVLFPLLKPETTFWIAYPKKSSGIISDLEMARNWKELDAIGWQTVASAAIDKTWTALRFRPKEQVKASGISDAAIQNNEFAAFIDTKNKIVTLPEDVKLALKNEPEALIVYQKLAYSHQKEYVIRIISAKQEKTRTSRVLKMIEKLLS